MAYIVMTLLIALSGVWAFFECRRGIKKYFEDKENMPSDKKIMIYVIVSTIINILLLALSYYFYDDKVIYAFKLALIFEWIIAIAGVDHYCSVIPNRLVLEGLAGAVLFAVVEILFASYPIFVSLKDYFFGFLLGAGVFFVSGLFVKGSIGAGDIKFFAVLGLLLGWASVFNLMFYTILISAVFSIFVLLLKRGDKKTMLPLAPFTYAGMVLILLMGI